MTTVAAAADLLERTPSILRAWLDGDDDAWTRTAYGPGTWSPFEVVGHLIHGERTDWIPRMRHIMQHGEEPPFAPFDRSGHEAWCRGRTMRELLATFDELRVRNLAELRGAALDAAALARRGTHPALGTVTLAQLIATWAAHDTHHLAQIAKSIAYRYRDDVGPWRAYIGILA